MLSTSSPHGCFGTDALAPTIIVSPLLALMRDQIEGATRMDLHAVTINSSNTKDWDPIEQPVHRR